jgi:hypothetical protein
VQRQTLTALRSYNHRPNNRNALKPRTRSGTAASGFLFCR